MNYTTIEQSRHLLELGLKAETADLFYDIHINPITKEKEGESIDFVCNWKSAWGDKRSISELFDERTVPAWSLDALLELMPQHIDQRTGWQKFGLDKGWDGSTYQVYYENKNSYVQERAATAMEASYGMVCWLLEKGFIKKED